MKSFAGIIECREHDEHCRSFLITNLNMSEVLAQAMDDHNRVERAKIGIISGSGPEAGIDLWGKILEENRWMFGANFRGDLDAPHVVIHSVPGLGLSMEMDRHQREVWAILEATVHKIAKDVDFFCIACNTLNYFEDDIRSLNLEAEFVSFRDVVGNYLRSFRAAEQTVALLGARPVAEFGKWSPYRNLAAEFQFEKIENLDEWHGLIEEIKKFGGDHPPVIARFRALLAPLQASVVLLACTELPLVPADFPGKELVDVTRLVAKEMAKKSFEASAN